MSPTIEQLTAGLTGEDLAIVSACFATRGKGKGTLKASKPFKTLDCIEGKQNAGFKGKVNYVWRMLCFDFLPSHPHCCMPITADWDLRASYPRVRYGQPGYEAQQAEMKAELDTLADLIKRAESNLPLTAQSGVIRWGRALGAI